jgi:hypothetical protein
MDPFATGIRQHDTHNALVNPERHRGASSAHLKLDAIIVPASRPAAHLDHAVTLAKAAGCWLLILCSQQLSSVEVGQFLAARSCHKAIAIDLPPGYSHELLYFPGLLSLRAELPQASCYYVTDLSMKRNIGLIMARMLGWHRIFFLDDDIRDITYPDLQSTVDMLGYFSAAGLWVTDFPDNSIACHASRMTKASQDVFVSGAALAVDCNDDIGFFPDIYNEDWLFFFDNASQGRLANSGLEATQLGYYPFADPQRAAWQEFGDVLAEGLYALLHLGLEIQHATREYWAYFLEARRTFLESVMTRSPNADPDIRAEMLLSVQSALKCLLTIKPDLCEQYVLLWRQDLTDWKRRVAGIPAMPSIEAALREMRLPLAAPIRSTGRVLPRLVEAKPAMMPGPVLIPQFDTLRQMPVHASTLRLSPISLADDKGDTIPFPVLTPSSATYEIHGRHRRPRSSINFSWLENIRDAARPSYRLGLSSARPLAIWSQARLVSLLSPFLQDSVLGETKYWPNQQQPQWRRPFRPPWQRVCVSSVTQDSQTRD